MAAYESGEELPEHDPTFRVHDFSKKADKQYGLVPKRNVLISVSSGYQADVIAFLDSYADQILQRESFDRLEGTDLSYADFLSRQAGCYGLYGAVTSVWEDDPELLGKGDKPKSYLWTFCEPGVQEGLELKTKLRDTFKGDITIKTFPGNALIISDHDSRAKETDWDALTNEDVSIVVHAPRGDYRRVEEAIMECERTGKIRDGVVYKWNAIGTWKSLPGSDPHQGDIGALEQTEYKMYWLSYALMDISQVMEVVKRRAQTFESPVMPTFLRADFLDDAITHTKRKYRRSGTAEWRTPEH